MRLLVAACAACSTLGASLWVGSRAGPATVTIPHLAGPSYARDISGFHQVTPSLVTDLAKKPSPRPLVSVPQPVERTPTTVPDVHAPAPEPSRGPTASTPPPSPTLGVTMSADLTRAHRNQTIVYTIRVTNSGPATAHGVVIESHVPDGTTLLGWTCGGTKVGAAGASRFTCGSVGSAHPDHPLVFAVDSLGNGETVVETFWVSVDHNVGHNTNIVDHAHVFARDADVVDSALVSVIVK